jgi:hypothetical protein
MNTEFSEVKIKVGEVTKKSAFATFNRDLNLKNVELIADKMREKGYRVGEPIQVIKAELALKMGIVSIIDINGKSIPNPEIEDYFLVLDGSHRTHATSRYNDWLIGQGNKPIEIPAIEIDLINGESITAYCNEINCTKKEWSKEDYVKGAASVFPAEVLLQRYNELIRSESNPKGFCLSTLNLIFCNGKGLTKSDLVLLCSGEIQKGSRTKQNIIPANNVEIGNKFIEICRLKEFPEEEITKRYLIKEFNDLRITSGGVDFALKVFQSITLDDISEMSNKYKKLDEQKVIDYFKCFKRILENPEAQVDQLNSILL